MPLVDHLECARVAAGDELHQIFVAELAQPGPTGARS